MSLTSKIATRFIKAPLSEDDLNLISETLAKGELVILPTETVYGLAADAFSEQAIASIFLAKQRPSTNPVIVHIASFDSLDALVSDIPDDAKILADAFWPGPLTMIFKKSSRLPSIVCGGGTSVGIRIPRQESTLKIIKKFGPLAAPSANIYTELSPSAVPQLSSKLLKSVTIVVDAGATEVGIESTVISVIDNDLRLLRPGMISKTQIEAIIGKPIAYINQHLEDKEERASPGLAKKHYSPRTPVRLGLPTPGIGKIGFISHHHAATSFVDQWIQLPNDAAGYAAGLYAAMHDLDHLELDWIYIQPLPDEDAWRAIRDRIERASCED